MKYVLAILACVAICIIYVVIGAGLGWKHGGGVIPMLILFAAIGATWRGITKNKANVKSQETNLSSSAETLNSNLHEEDV